MANARFSCPKCELSFGQEKRLLDHLTDFHGITDHQSFYVEHVLNGSWPTCECGWKMIAEDTGQRFWWMDFTHRYNRFKYKADRSQKMTQAQVAEAASVAAIYGCSNTRWEIAV